MAETGITSLLDQLGSIRTGLKDKGFSNPVDLTKLAARETALRNYLGQTDYSKQLAESQNMGKLQFALDLARRGFESAGATPNRGENPISTVSRELLAPIAGSAGEVATEMMKQRRAVENAKRQEERQIKLATLSQAQAESKALDASSLSLLAARSKSNANPFSATKVDDVSATVTLNGKILQVPIANVVVQFDKTNPGKQRIITIGSAKAKDADGNEITVPEGTVASSYEKRGSVNPPKFEGGFFGQVFDKNTNTFVSINNVTRYQKVTPPTVPGGSPDVTNIYYKQNPGGKLEQLPSFVENIKTHNPFSKTDSVYVVDPKAVSEALGVPESSVRAGDVIQTFVQNAIVPGATTITERRFKGNVVTNQLTEKLINTDAIQTTPLTEKQKNKLAPFETKPFGTTPKELTVIGEDGEPKIIQAVLMQTGPSEFRWKETGEDGKFVDERYQKEFWETITDDKEYQNFRPVLDQAFKSAVERQSGNLGSDVVKKIGEQVLTSTDIKRLVKLTGSDRAEAINSIINSRVRSLTKETPEETVTLPESVLELDPRVKSLVEVPSGANPNTNPVVNPRILQPWTKAGSNIQLGSGSHEGFSQKITAKDVTDSRKNYPAIKKGFDAVYGGTKSLGDNVERILLFSGLWKNLPGVAKGMGARELSESEFRKTYDEAAVKYNKAAEEYKPAAALDVGKGNQSKNLQAALDDQTDALRDNAIMLRFKDQGGAFSLTGTWLAEMRGSGFGELFEAWSGTDGTASKESYASMPSNKWADISKPDNQLNAEDLALKKRAFQYLQDASSSAGKRTDIGLTEFERAAEYLGALSRYKIRAFSMIKDSRPSDKDIEILLKAFVGDRDSDTVAFAKLSELQNKHTLSLERNIKTGIEMKAVFDPVFLATLDHTSRLLKRSSVRDLNPKKGGRAPETAALFRRSSERIRKAAESASGRIIPGNRSGAISPMSGNVDEESTANLYRNVLSAAKKVYPDKTDQEAVQEFVRQGLHLTSFAGVYGTDRISPPLVRERDGSFTLSVE